MFRNIVAATDDSAHARKAIDLASELAVKYQAKLILVHVLQQARIPESVRHLLEVEHVAEPQPAKRPPTADYSVMLASTMDQGGQANAALRRAFDAWGKQILEGAASMARERGVQEVVTVLEEGDPVNRILECVERENADLLVVGSRGLSDLKGLFLGSVSHKLSQLARCTCITVK
jgi:nucleotide-binding universal stress UspA family protein